jgi:hypothetical protein
MVGAQGAERGRAVLDHRLEVGGLGGLAFGVLQHQPQMVGAGCPPLLAGGAGAHIPQELDQAAGQRWLGGPEPPDLGGAAPQVLLKVGQRDRHPQDPQLVAAQLVAQPSAGARTHSRTERWWTAWMAV